MMDDNALDIYLNAYKKQTQITPSRRLLDNILSIPDRVQSGKISLFDHPWHVFNLMLPKAVGWALTGILGVYLGFSSMEPEIDPVGDDYYLYAHAQILLSENLPSEGFEE